MALPFLARFATLLLAAAVMVGFWMLADWIGPDEQTAATSPVFIGGVLFTSAVLVEIAGGGALLLAVTRVFGHIKEVLFILSAILVIGIVYSRYIRGRQIKVKR